MVYSKKEYLNRTKIFVLRLFKIAAANQTECSRLEQRSVIKFVVAEKCKPCEMYRRMCDIYGETCLCFWSKNIYKWTNHGFGTKYTDFLAKKNNDFQVKKTFLVLWSAKKVMLTVTRDMKEPMTHDFLKEGATVYRAFYCQLVKQNLPYLLNDPHIYIYIYII